MGKIFNLPVAYSTLDWKKGEKKFVREQYVKDQEGKCYYCSAPLNGDPPSEITDKDIDWGLFPPNFLQHPIHLQHCHKTDMTEGAVHAYCNAVLWQYDGK